MKIEVKNLTKYFGNFTALQDINLNIVEGELLYHLKNKLIFQCLFNLLLNPIPIS